MPSPSSADDADHSARWRRAFAACLQEPERSAPLKEAALSKRLGAWTALLTAGVVESCRALGWRAAAKGSPLDLLPQAGQEYLGLDVMAFEPRQQPQRWPFPVAAFELENSTTDDRVAYSLWKVLCVRCALRVVFAYREDWEQARELIRSLTIAVVEPIPPEERSGFAGQTVVIVGSRGEGEVFPWGYFKVWQLDANLGQFEKR